MRIFVLVLFALSACVSRPVAESPKPAVPELVCAPENPKKPGRFAEAFAKADAKFKRMIKSQK